MASNSSNAHHIVMTPDLFEPFHMAIGYQVGDLIFLSGQVAEDDHGDVVGGDDFDAQAEQVFKNISRVLDTAGSSVDKIFKVTIYVTDMSHYPKILAFRQKYFSKPYPADTTVEVKSLAMPEYLLEIEAIALVDGNLV
jgi:reactive intermediate/imine deaminase